MTDPIAVTALVLAAASIAWQVFTWRHGRKTHVRVSLHKEGVLLKTEIPGRGEIESDRLTIHVVNLSDRPVRIARAALVGIESGRSVFLHSLQHIIPPHDSLRTTYLPALAPEEGLKEHEPVEAEVETATGLVFRSRQERL